MKSNDILDMIGDAKGTYVWDAQKIRSGAVPVAKKKASSQRTLLIAAMIALMLLLVGCTIAYVQGWFVDFFSAKSETPLSDSQISLIEQNEQQINEAQTQNGWTVRDLPPVLTHAVHLTSQKPRKDGQSGTCRPSSRTPSTSPLRNLTSKCRSTCPKFPSTKKLPRETA